MFYVWLLCVVLTVIAANTRGHNGWWGLLWGLLFGPAALIVYLVIPRNQNAIEDTLVISGQMRKCPECAELIRPEATRCRFCSSSLQPAKGGIPGIVRP